MYSGNPLIIVVAVLNSEFQVVFAGQMRHKKRPIYRQECSH